MKRTEWLRGLLTLLMPCVLLMAGGCVGENEFGNADQVDDRLATEKREVERGGQVQQQVEKKELQLGGGPVAVNKQSKWYPKVLTEDEFKELRKQKINIEVPVFIGDSPKVDEVIEVWEPKAHKWVSIGEDAYSVEYEDKVAPDGKKAGFNTYLIDPTQLKEFWQTDRSSSFDVIFWRAYDRKTREEIAVYPLNMNAVNNLDEIDRFDGNLVQVQLKESGGDRYFAVIGQKGFVDHRIPDDYEKLNDDIKLEHKKELVTRNIGNDVLMRSYRASSIAYEIHDWPMNYSSEYTNALQGMTHDYFNWYFVNSSMCGNSSCRWHEFWGDKSHYNRLMWYDKSDNLAQFWSSHEMSNPFPEYNHPGGMTYRWVRGGELTIALTQRRNNGEWTAFGIIPFNDWYDKSKYNRLYLPGSSEQHSGNLPWVAYDKFGDSYYSSRFFKNGGYHLNRYKVVRSSNGTPLWINDCGRISITGLGNYPIKRVQGGEFSPSGKLYLSTDPQDQSSINNGAIRVIQLNRTKIDKEPCSPSTWITAASSVGDIFVNKRAGTASWTDEIEDITIWDLDGGAGYQGRSLGQIHTQLIDVDLGNDDLYLKHHRISSGVQL